MIETTSRWANLHEQFALALQEACLERNTPVLVMGWGELVDAFYKNYLKHSKEIHGSDITEETFLSLDATQILDNSRGVFLEDFMSHGVHEPTMKISIYGLLHGEHGRRSIDTKVSIVPNKGWVVSQYVDGEHSRLFMGLGEDCLADLRKSFEEIFSSDEWSSKEPVNEFLDDLERLEYAVPFELPEDQHRY